MTKLQILGIYDRIIERNERLAPAIGVCENRKTEHLTNRLFYIINLSNMTHILIFPDSNIRILQLLLNLVTSLPLVEATILQKIGVYKIQFLKEQRIWLHQKSANLWVATKKSRPSSSKYVLPPIAGLLPHFYLVNRKIYFEKQK